MTTSPEAAAFANLRSLFTAGMRTLTVAAQAEEETHQAPSVPREAGPQGQTRFITFGNGKKLWY